MRFCRSFVLLCLMVNQVACQGGLQRLIAGTPPEDPQAEALKRSGQFQGAIRRYEQLAKSSGQPDHYGLEAADTALRSGDAEAAQQWANTLKVQNLSQVDRDRWALLSSRLDLSAGRAQDALVKLNSLPEQRLSEADQRNFHLLKASALNQQGDLKGSALERIALTPLLNRQEDIERNFESLLDTLERLPNKDLKTSWSPPPADMAGWLALALIMKTSGDENATALDQWQRQYPHHPAVGRFLKRLKGASKEAHDEGPRKGSFIGVLLPQEGPFASAAKTIQKGLESAHEGDPQNQKPTLRVLDASAGHLLADLHLLENEGAIGMIGPLIKEDVSTLMGQPIKVPVLALNQVDGDGSKNLFQFGLTPEDEVEQVATKAFADGRRRAIILYPETAFGHRLADHFKHTWQRLGGELFDQRAYPEAAEAALSGPPPWGPLTAADMVFLIADPHQARILVPRLHEAHGPKIYTTSHIFEDLRDDLGNQALNGVIVCDMPAVLTAPKEDHAESARLMAFGRDAYRILPTLKAGSIHPDWRWEGETGSLHMNESHQIKRDLTCREWVSGHLDGAAPKEAP
ncbi:MAG: penicillin-binding protein activator [Methylococcus sp.]